jgi:hypothetical protein
MDSSVICPHCSKLISADANGRVPPWCRACGADVKPAVPPPLPPMPPDPAVPSTPAITDRPAPARAAEPSPLTEVASPAFFHAYANDDVYRVYVTEFDLLVFRLGPGSVSGGQVVPRTKMQHRFAVGMVAAVAMWRESQRIQAGNRMREILEGADEEMLREYAEAGDGGYVLCPDDLLGEIRIDPPSWLSRLFGSEAEGVLRFGHRREGNKSLALPTVGDVRRSAEAIQRLFGDAAQINLPWAASRAQEKAI